MQIRAIGPVKLSAEIVPRLHLLLRLPYSSCCPPRAIDSARTLYRACEAAISLIRRALASVFVAVVHVQHCKPDCHHKLHPELLLGNMRVYTSSRGYAKVSEVGGLDFRGSGLFKSLNLSWGSRRGLKLQNALSVRPEHPGNPDQAVMVSSLDVTVPSWGIRSSEP